MVIVVHVWVSSRLYRVPNEDKGSYVEMDRMYEVHSARISIHLDHPSPAHTDGELFPNYVQDFEYSIQPGRLQLLVP